MTLFADVRRRVLENGLEVLVREDHASPVVSLNFFVRVGSLNEDEAIAGWSHGIEHMLFKGTSRRGPGEIAREIQEAGGETNASTGYESTSYYITLPAENFDVALDIHADVLRHSAFDEEELAKEREVLLKENEMYRDRPSGYGFAWEGLLAEAFTTHRYRRPIGGPDENLRRVPREEILRFKETYYVPNNIVYVVVGDVDAERVFREVEKKLGDWPRRDFTPDQSPPEPEQTEFRYRETAGDVEKCYVKIGFHVPPEMHPDTTALLVLANILATGRSSRLYRKVREEQGLILSARVLETTGAEPGYLAVELTAEVDKADDALAAVTAEILRFQREPVSPGELERVLRSVESGTFHALETMEGQAGMLGHYALLGDYRWAGTYLERVAAVTAERIREVAAKYLSLEKATVYLHAPRGKRPSPPPASAVFARLRKAAATWLESGGIEATSKEPESGKRAPVKASGRPRGEVEAVTLQTGARVLLQPDGRLPLVAAAMTLGTGSGAEAEEEAGLTRLTQVLMLKGAGGRSAADMDEELERLGIRLVPFTSRDLSGFHVSAMRPDFPRAMELFRAVLSQPDFPEEALERERERTLIRLASLRDDTVRFTMTEYFALLYPDHPYGRPVEGREESVASFRVEDLRRWHRRVFDPSRMVWSVVGDFDRDEILALVEQTTGALAAPSSSPPRVLPVAFPPDGSRKELHKDVAQAVVVLGYPGPVVNSPDRYALEVWNAVLSGMGNRLFTRLRDQRHLCYFTGAFVAPLREGGTLGAYVGTGPDQVEEATEALVRELEGSLREPPDETELRRARNTLAGTFLIDMQTRMAWASTFARDEALGLGYREASRYLDGVRAVTAEAVQEAAARYIRPERLTVAVLRPEAEASSSAGAGAAVEPGRGEA